MNTAVKKCPMCAEQIPADAVLCPYCGTRFGEEVQAVPPPAEPAPPVSTAPSPVKISHAGFRIAGAAVLVILCGVIGTLLWIQRASLPGLSGLLATPTPTATLTATPTLTPTITLTPTPRPTATATPAPAWVTDFAQPILDAIASRPPSFQDDFGLGSAGWSGRRISYLDGELVLIDSNANRTQMDYADFVVEFDARFLPDTNKNYRSNWAISFRNYDVSNYYFGVYFDGSVRLGNLVCDHLDFPYAANPGLETNHLMMIAKGSQFAFYINNKPFYYVENPSIWRWQGDILLGDGTEGPDLGAIVAFDNFKIWNIYGLP